MLVSNVGTWMQMIAQGWLVYQISGSEFILGLTGFASAIPALAISPLGACWWTVFLNVLVIQATQTAAMLLAFILAGLTAAGVVNQYHILGLAFMLGIVNAFDAPARQAFTVDLVEREDLPNAIALNALMFNSARVLGPALGGLLLAAVGAAWCFAINGVSFLAVLVSLSVMKLPAHRPNPNPQSPLRDLASGLRYVRAHPEIAGLLMLSAVFSMFGFAYQSQLPAYARDILQVGPQGYGIITATVGLGAVSGALLLARYSNRIRRGRWLVIANFAFPFVLALLAVVHNFNAVLLLCYLLGLCFIAQGNLTNVLLQTRVEDSMRGRVMGFFTLTFFGFAPFGNLIVGSLAKSAGLVTALLVSAGSVFVLSQIVVWKVPRIKDT